VGASTFGHGVRRGGSRREAELECRRDFFTPTMFRVEPVAARWSFGPIVALVLGGQATRSSSGQSTEPRGRRLSSPAGGTAPHRPAGRCIAHAKTSGDQATVPVRISIVGGTTREADNCSRSRRIGCAAVAAWQRSWSGRRSMRVLFDRTVRSSLCR
jgi:hypothetical protein